MLKDFVAAISDLAEREAGQNAMCIFLIAGSYALWAAKFPKAEDLFIFAMGVLARNMGSAALKEATTPDKATTTSTVTKTEVSKTVPPAVATTASTVQSNQQAEPPAPKE